MEFRALEIEILILTYCGLCCVGEYTEFTTLLWLKASENVDPAEVWSNASSSYNNAVNTTLQTLISGTSTGYRNTIIDSWAENQPDMIRVSYLNADGIRLYSEEFNSSGSSMIDWFTKDRTLPLSISDYILNTSFTSYSTSFSQQDNDWGTARYRAVVIPNYVGTTYFLVYNQPETSLLPTQVLNATERCHASFPGLNPFAYNFTVTNLFHGYCSSKCRESNYIAAAVHDSYCSCLDADVTGPALSSCNTICSGSVEQTCGGLSPSGYPTDSIIFDEVLTNIDVSQFDTPLKNFEEVTVNGSAQIVYSSNRFIYGFRVSIPSTASFPMSINLMLYFRPESCSLSSFNDTLLEKTFTVPDASEYVLGMDPILAQCVTIHLLDLASNQSLTVPVNMTTVAITDEGFVTASILSVEAAWLIDTDVTTNVTEQCECECWVHNLLYGDSPYNNLTYDEIEIALKNVTDKIERELTVNKSELSSTKRSKTSAEDKRQSATAVGYTLGVALLSLSIGGIILADVPKLLGNLSLMRENLISRFCPNKACPSQSPPDVTITNTSDHTSML